MDPIEQLKIKIYADGADLNSMSALYKDPLIKGFTTNPTLMHQAGIRDYKAFAFDILQVIRTKPISFEVFSDDFKEMYAQAMEIASWADNVYVKVPVTNTRGEKSLALVRHLAKSGVKQNITALLTLSQVAEVTAALSGGPSAYISVFAGRIADTGRDPVATIRDALALMRPHPHLELIWASPREILNIFQADQIGCSIITVTHDLLKKLSLVGKDLTAFSLETVKMFYNDAVKAGFAFKNEFRSIETLFDFAD